MATARSCLCLGRKLRIYGDGKLSEPIGGVPKVEYHEQGGLLDVAVDPDFATNQLVYLSYTEAALEQPADAKDEGDPRLGEYQDLNDAVLKGLAVARGRLDGDQLKDVLGRDWDGITEVRSLSLPAIAKDLIQRRILARHLVRSYASTRTARRLLTIHL